MQKGIRCGVILHRKSMSTIKGMAVKASRTVQDKEFYTSQNVCVLHTNDSSISEKLKWFVATSITASCGNYEAFTDELNRHIRTDFIIRILMNKTNQPDWAYMEEYMRKVEERVKTTIEELEVSLSTK